MGFRCSAAASADERSVVQAASMPDASLLWGKPPALDIPLFRGLKLCFEIRSYWLLAEQKTRRVLKTVQRRGAKDKDESGRMKAEVTLSLCIIICVHGLGARDSKLWT
jgi:hypothetical protein